MTKLFLPVLVLGLAVVGTAAYATFAPIPANAVWVQLNPTQCLSNPWEQDWLAQPGHEYADYPKERETRIITDYYAKQGIQIIRIESKLTNEIVCRACSCPRGDTLFFLVSEADANTLIGQGFSPSADPGA